MNPFSTGRLNLECVTLQDLIQAAYGMFADGGSFNPGMTPISISGAPGWVQSDHYDVAAKADGAARVEQMMGPLMRTLLEDRFKLKIHRESKEVPVYALTAAKNGFKLQPVKEGSCIVIDLNHLPEPPEPGQPQAQFLRQYVDENPPHKGTTMGRAWHEYERLCANALLGSWTARSSTRVASPANSDFHLEFAPDDETADDFPAAAAAGRSRGNNAPLDRERRKARRSIARLQE